MNARFGGAFLGLLLFVAPLDSASSYDDAKFNRLYHEMDVFFRELHGCPATGYPPTIECLGTGSLNYAQWKKVSRLGEDLFDGKLK